MALPFTSAPHVLSVDDVWPVEIVNKLVTKCDDARAHLAKEHHVDTGHSGHHSVITIPVAGACIKAANANADGVKFVLDSWGFIRKPTWQIMWGVNKVKSVFTVRKEAHWDALHVATCVRWNSATFSATDACVPLVEPDRDWPRRMTMWLGAPADAANIAHVLILVFGIRLP